MTFHMVYWASRDRQVRVIPLLSLISSSRFNLSPSNLQHSSAHVSYDSVENLSAIALKAFVL